MRVLAACEYSGAVRRAFAARGHDAWSCDLLPAEDVTLNHIQGDVLPPDACPVVMEAMAPEFLAANPGGALTCLPTEVAYSSKKPKERP